MFFAGPSRIRSAPTGVDFFAGALLKRDWFFQSPVQVLFAVVGALLKRDWFFYRVIGD
jgi:hypothetical protein